ncbi:hypothetical protein AN5298.2 [Aspergillus nidulans FGSC A4]|uniref:Mitochondrial thiamine pyrophosphate carrier 1 n=1 Tax=Emericella nidulans (strain FGSC A4 / ATCC 38163 / CBS 112.46 / NRRL 194 / M139) TaxID=227321 RepID=Q5B2D2_EMENI|nr:hypothetical protein [Aspergillus nidulans FGSC A4]EAA62458.1 hypothetical protein AN5298.2 [Aspergillus nidulans FGSC A4]CBF82147.1 TPA: hypothetical protein ANIA_05298 [Aspergillus nidulans FGSC A4]|eukprot:XP_662902.1 hypothetical protein AN5298.2 [Aspergillus nidulans FGSC A4]
MKNSSPSLWQSILAGEAAGGFESPLTLSPRLNTGARGILRLQRKQIRSPVLRIRDSTPIDAHGHFRKVHRTGNMGAGIIAGAAESILVVTPGETLKTKIIDNEAGAKRYTSARALSGRRLPPRESPAMSGSDSNNSVIGATVVAGALAGVVTVYATMPFDTLKTRLQALDARQRYNETLDCLKTIRFL